MITASQRRAHESWLLDLTMIPTAAGREDRVIAWVEAWTKKRAGLRLRRDAAGNLIITRTGRRSGKPLFITAHLDHPAFVVRRVRDDGRTLDLEFRGSVHPPYFDDAKIEVFDADDEAHPAVVTRLDAKAKPFKHVTARLSRATDALAEGDVGRWRLRGPLPRIVDGRLYTHACDDLAGVAAALAALDVLHRRDDGGHVGVLLTRAEEVGFIGTLAACEGQTIPTHARLVCLENSRSFPDSPIGGGPILRVGDRMSVFAPELTNGIGDLMTAYARKDTSFRWQRKLMPGGSCEATAFSAHGYASTCLCLPLGNYHNMAGIDAVLAGKRPARVGPEFIAVDDYHGLVRMLVVCATQLDGTALPSMGERLAKLLDDYGFVLDA